MNCSAELLDQQPTCEERGSCCISYGGIRGICFANPLLAGYCDRRAFSWTPLRWEKDNYWHVPQDTCTTCSPDTYSGGSDCRRCEAGYQATDDKTGCLMCPAGWYSAQTWAVWHLTLSKRSKHPFQTQGSFVRADRPSSQHALARRRLDSC